MTQSIKEQFDQQPLDSEIETLSNGGRFIPINKQEIKLDTLHSWSTQNFHFHLFRMGYDTFSIAASIELVIEYWDPEIEDIIKRIFVGACNFPVKSIYPNPHFLATAKSECIKNACTDIGAFFGRGLNENMTVPNPESSAEADGGVTLLESFDEIKPE